MLLASPSTEGLKSQSHTAASEIVGLSVGGTPSTPTAQLGHRSEASNIVPGRSQFGQGSRSCEVIVTLSDATFCLQALSLLCMNRVILPYRLKRLANLGLDDQRACLHGTKANACPLVPSSR